MILFLFLLSCLTVDCSENKYVKGTWLTTFFSACDTLSHCEDTMKVLSYANINRVYVACFDFGQVLFKSKTMFDAIGSAGIGTLNLQYAVESAKKYNISVVGWFESGLKAADVPVSPGVKKYYDYVKSKGWLLFDGDKTARKGVWLNMTIPEVRDFLVGILTDALINLPDLNGVQIDDHFQWCEELEDGKKRYQEVTEAMKYVISNVRKNVNRKFLFSHAPGFNKAWEAWTNVPFSEWISEDNVDFDEYIPQLYESNVEKFEKDMDEMFEIVEYPKCKDKVIIGTEISLLPEPKTCVAWNETEAMIRLTQQKELKGTSIWFDRAIVDCYSKEFHQFW